MLDIQAGCATTPPRGFERLHPPSRSCGAGEGSLAGNDGWLSLHAARLAPLSCVTLRPSTCLSRQQAILDALSAEAPAFPAVVRRSEQRDAARRHRRRPALADDLVAPRLGRAGLTKRHASPPRGAPPILRCLNEISGRAHPGERAAPAAIAGTRAPRIRRPVGAAIAAGRWSPACPTATPTQPSSCAPGGHSLERHACVVTRGAAQAERVGAGSRPALQGARAAWGGPAGAPLEPLGRRSSARRDRLPDARPHPRPRRQPRRLKRSRARRDQSRQPLRRCPCRDRRADRIPPTRRDGTTNRATAPGR